MNESTKTSMQGTDLDIYQASTTLETEVVGSFTS